eukprot:m.1011804 g.1011804  ORF g.1011804 m.1011804 type:complete len:365 (+) comp24063_c1_seq1:133-1227(+)
MMDLQEKVAVVTGAAMGMGRCLALRLRREGCHLALCDVDMDALNAVVQECRQIQSDGRIVTAHKVDVSCRSEVAEFVKKSMTEHNGHCHMLFNNAGIHNNEAFDIMSEATFDRVMGVNVDGVVTMTRYFWPYLTKMAEASVVNISSVAGFLPTAAGASSPYAASKYAVRGFSEHLAMQCNVIAPHITVSCVHPGAIRTEIVKKLDAVDMRFVRYSYPMLAGRLDAIEDDIERRKTAQEFTQKVFDSWGYSAEDAANMIVDGAKNKQTRIMVGWDAVMMDWWVRLFPRIFMTRLGGGLVMLTSLTTRHFFLPGVLACAAAGAAHRRSMIVRDHCRFLNSSTCCSQHRKGLEVPECPDRLPRLLCR